MTLYPPYEIVRDEGTVVVMTAETEDGKVQSFAADQRMAYNIIEAEPEALYVEGWQLLG